MKATRKVNWTMKDGRNVEITIEISRNVSDKIAYADGANVNIGKETQDLTIIEMTADGKHITRSYHAPHILTRESYRNSFDKLTAAGAYARLGDAYIAKETYEMVMEAYNAAIAEINAPATEEAKTESAEYETVKAAEVAKENAIINAKSVKRGPGWCDKCQSYCWGDCEAS